MKLFKRKQQAIESRWMVHGKPCSDLLTVGREHGKAFVIRGTEPQRTDDNGKTIARKHPLYERGFIEGRRIGAWRLEQAATAKQRESQSLAWYEHLRKEAGVR